MHAALDSSKDSNEIMLRDLYSIPRTNTPSTSLLGRSHESSFLDMVPPERDKEPDIKQRDLRDEYVGFACSYQTSHSYEAARSQRVATEMLARAMSYSTYVWRARMVPGAADATVTHYSNTSASHIDQLCTYHRLKSVSADQGFGLYVKRVFRSADHIMHKFSVVRQNKSLL